MRSLNNSNQRERSRQRNSRDRSYPNARDASPDFDSYRRPYTSHQFAKNKRVKFNDQEDIRVFKKEDQPNTKNLSEDQIFLVKQQIQKEISRVYDFNWDQKKHFDALSQQNSMKEVFVHLSQQKQKEKQLYEKLMSMKQQTEFYAPYSLVVPMQLDSETGVSIPQAGNQSSQKEAHSQRIRDVLGCYYTQINEIPNQPIFEVSTQSNKNSPRIIRFSPGGINQAQDFAKSQNKNQKQMKGILKMPGQNARTSVPKQSEERQISPRLLWLLKQLQVNKQKYNRQMTQLLLKPFKDSGELDYWMGNQALLNEKLKNQPVGVQPPPSNVPVQPVVPPQTQVYPPVVNRMSPSPSNEFRPQFQYEPNPQIKTEKYKTVPCKYFHSPQGCVKTQNCTFIHDQKYRGQQLPYMYRAPYQPQTGNTYGNTGYQQNQGYPRRQQNLQPFNSYNQNPQSAQTGGYGSYQTQNSGYYNNSNSQYSQGRYGQTNKYPNYGQGGQISAQQGLNTMGQQPGQIPTQQNFGQMGQQPGQNYPGYTKPQQMQMYYGQGQGNNGPPRSSTEK